MFLDTLRNIFGSPVSTEKKLKLARRETEKLYIAEQELEKQRLEQLHERYEDSQELPTVYPDLFSAEETIDLSIERIGIPVCQRPFRSLYITRVVGTAGIGNPLFYIRFNSVKATPKYTGGSGWVKGEFSSLYVYNTAQADCSFTFITTMSKRAEFRIIAPEVIIST